MPSVDLTDFFESQAGDDGIKNYRPKPVLPPNKRQYMEREDFDTYRNSNGLPNLHNRKTRLDSITHQRLTAQITGLYKDGKYLGEITEQINIEYGLENERALTSENVRDVIRAQVDYWRKAGLWSIDEKMAYALARNDQIEALAYESFKLSCQGKKTVFFEKKINRAKATSPKNPKIESRREAEEEMRPEFEQSLLTKEEDPKRLGKIEELLTITGEDLKEYTRIEANEAGDPRWLVIMQNCGKERAKLWGLYTKEKENNQDEEFARLGNEERAKRISAILAEAKMRRENYVSNLAPSSPLGGHPEKPEEKEIVTSQSFDKASLLGLDNEDEEE